MKKFFDSFKTKGLIDLGHSMWVTTEPCIINNCEVNRGTLIIDSLACKFKHDTSKVKTDDLILVQGATLSFYSYNSGCAGKLLPTDNKLRAFDTLEYVDFDFTDYDFNGNSMLYDVQTGNGKNEPYTFDTCHSSVNLLINKDGLLNFLDTYSYNKLSDVGSFCYTKVDKFGDNHDVKYTPVLGIKGLYVKSDHVSYADSRIKYVDSSFEWVTKDDIRRFNEISQYGIVMSHDDKEVYNLSDPVLDSLKVIDAIHKRDYITKGVDYDTGIDVGDFNVSVDSFKNVYDTILNLDNEDLSKPNHIRESQEFKEDAGEDYYCKSVSFNIYFTKDALPCGLNVEPFNMVFDDEFCKETDGFYAADDKFISAADAKGFVLKDVDVISGDEYVGYASGCYYKGDIILADGSIIKNVSTTFDLYSSGNIAAEMRSMALLSRAYRQHGDKLDVNRLRHDLAIVPSLGGKAIDLYLEYKQSNTVDLSMEPNRLKLVHVDGMNAKLVSDDKQVSGIDIPEVTGPDASDDKCVE
jgi:hypothetical protein